MALLILMIATVTIVIFILILFYMFIEHLALKYINKYTSPMIYRNFYRIYASASIVGLIFTLMIINYLTRDGDPNWEGWNLANYRHILWQQISAWVQLFSFSFPGLALLSRQITKKTVIEQRNLIKEAGRLEKIGKPIIYKTTDEFLKLLNIEKLEDLPPIENYENDNE